MAGPLTALPKLREDLRLLKAGPSLSGAPGWVIHDPASNKYFQLTFEVFQLLSLWNRCETPDALTIAVFQRFGRTVDPAEIEAVLRIVSDGQLLQAADGSGWRALHQRSIQRQVWYKRAFHGYLFFKLPLVQPQAFLAATWPLVRPLFSQTFLVFIAIIGTIGLYLVSRQWETFVNSFPYVFTFEGAVVSILAVMLVKSLHELGHGYVAYRYGCHIPTMGLAFMAFVPMLYTDITDAWKLKSSRQRLMIDSAGIQVELVIGLLCLFLWAFLPDGAVRSAVFVTATVSWVISLLINLNPMMRFDGYFILSDFLGMPNLHERAFAHMRFRLRQLLFATGEEPSEHFSPGLDFGLIIFAIATTIYRIGLYIGIALLVYHFFIKVVGIGLLLGEVMFFMIQPVWRELKVWWSMRKSIVARPRSYMTGFVGMAAVACLFMPLSSSIEAPALLEPEQFLRLYPEAAGRLAKIHVKAGDTVKVGDLLFTLDVPGLAAEQRVSTSEIALLTLRLSRIAVDSEDLGNRQVLEQQLVAAKAKLQGLESAAERLAMRASFTGKVLEITPRLYEGKWVSRAEQLGLLAAGTRTFSRGFVTGDDLPRIGPGNTATFVPDDITQGSQKLVVSSVAATSSKIIDLAPLASVYGGRIAVIQSPQNELVPVAAQYVIKAAAAGESAGLDQVKRGVLRVDATSESLASRAMRQVMKVLVRESGA